MVGTNTCGMGLNGARIMKTATTIRTEYGILSRIAHIIFLKGVTKSKISLISQLNKCLSRK